MKSFTISCLICAINLNFAKNKIAQKGKRLSRLPEVQKVAPDGKSCSKVTIKHNIACKQAKHNRDTPTSVKDVYNRVKEWSLPWGCLHIKLKTFASVEPLPG